MDPGILHAAAALDLISKMQDARAQNLANAATVGYRKRLSSAEAFSSALRQASGLEVPRFQEAIDFRQGDLRHTGEPLDLAIDGKGFFAVATERGERFTRAGAFQLDAEGFITTPDGHRLEGRTGALQLDPARGQPSIDRKGAVMQEGEVVGSVRIVEFEDERTLPAEDGGLFRAAAAAPPRDDADSSVLQGQLEAGNVDAVDELVQMIGGFRAFESAQRAMVGIDRVRTSAVTGR
jgi:flagellar basal-body rod protein FlgF